MIEDVEANSLGELIERVRVITDAFKINPDEREEIWFRGQSSCEWPLVPNLYRSDVLKYNYHECTLIDRFVSLASPLVNRIPASDWEWYFLARHHGLPSRLLDWTESLFMAAYFAVMPHLPKDRLQLDTALRSGSSKKDYDHCPTVWVLDAGTLNRVSLGLDRIVVPGGPRSKPYLPDQLDEEQSDKNAKPIAILPVRSNSRIVAQHGMFTVHGHEHTPIDFVASADSRLKLARIRLDKARVPEFAADLRRCGIHRLTAFPDLDSVVEHICWVCQSAV